MKKSIRISITILLALAISLSTIFVYAHSVKAYTVYPFDKVNVLDDLESMEDFNVEDYPFDITGRSKLSVITFVEWCYSTRREKRNDFAMYIYVYNPQGIDIDTASTLNKVQIAVDYDKYPITAESKPTEYEKFNLVYCNQSTKSGYEGLFYKFRIIDHKTGYLTIQERVNSHQRRYDVSGIELLQNGKYTADEYGVNTIYTFTGFSEGYGPDIAASSTLKGNVQCLETVSLNVNHTYWRSKTSSKGAGYQNQLDTVYFSVPKRLIEKYGRLQRIKAEWYEYYTKDIVVTSNQEFYNKAKEYVGVNMNREHNESIVYGLGQNAGDAGGGIYMAEWGWNLGSHYLHTADDIIYYLFPTENWCSISKYDPYGDTTKNGGVSSNALYDYVKAYDKTFKTGTVKDGKISADLFEKDIPNERKMDNEQGKIQYGYSYYDFDADIDTQKWLSYSETEHSFWEDWKGYGFWNAITGAIPQEEGAKLCPIYILGKNDLVGTNTEIAQRLYVNYNDVEDIKTAYNAATTVSSESDEERVLVLFRFAKSDYYSAGLDLIDIDGGFLWEDAFTEGQAYRAKESIFLDFDIIQLTFNKDEVYTVIPVVSSPMDIVNDITTPSVINENNWWQALLALILFVLLIIFLWKIGLLPAIGKGIVWLVTAPFKAIGWTTKELTKKEKDK